MVFSETNEAVTLEDPGELANNTDENDYFEGEDLGDNLKAQLQVILTTTPTLSDRSDQIETLFDAKILNISKEGNLIKMSYGNPNNTNRQRNEHVPDTLFTFSSDLSLDYTWNEFVTDHNKTVSLANPNSVIVNNKPVSTSNKMSDIMTAYLGNAEKIKNAQTAT